MSNVILSNELVEISGEQNLSALIIHCEYKKSTFTATDYKQLIIIWDYVLTELAKLNINSVISIIPKDKKLMQWQEMFGLSPLLDLGESVIYKRDLRWD